MYFPIYLLSPNMLLDSMCLYEDMYDIEVLFRNRKSYLDLKPHHI